MYSVINININIWECNIKKIDIKLSISIRYTTIISKPYINTPQFNTTQYNGISYSKKKQSYSCSKNNKKFSDNQRLVELYGRNQRTMQNSRIWFRTTN